MPAWICCSCSKHATVQIIWCCRCGPIVFKNSNSASLEDWLLKNTNSISFEVVATYEQYHLSLRIMKSKGCVIIFLGLTFLNPLTEAYNIFPPLFTSQSRPLDQRKCRNIIVPDSATNPVQTAVESLWFPVTKEDLDFVSQSSEDGGKLSSDHPGFHDPVYRARRRMIADKALQYRHGQKLPTIQYTPSEEHTWRTVYEALRAASRSYAVDEYKTIVDEMERSFGFGGARIPQMQEVELRSLRSLGSTSYKPCRCAVRRSRTFWRPGPGGRCGPPPGCSRRAGSSTGWRCGSSTARSTCGTARGPSTRRSPTSSTSTSGTRRCSPTPTSPPSARRAPAASERPHRSEWTRRARVCIDARRARSCRGVLAPPRRLEPMPTLRIARRSNPSQSFSVGRILRGPVM